MVKRGATYGLAAALGIAGVAQVSGRAFAQQVAVEVNMHLEKLPLDEQKYLDGLDFKLAELLNRYDWSSGAYRYQMPVTVDIIPDSYSLQMLYHKYSAGVMVATKSGIQMRDTRWDFRLNRDEPLHMGLPYDSFTGLVEFYIWMALGFENDLLKPVGGQPFYDKALAVSDAARFESQFGFGWDYRRDLARDFSLDTTYRNIRLAAFHARAGIYYADRAAWESALPYLTRAVELLLTVSPAMTALRRDDHIIRFIDLPRFVAALNSCGDAKLLEALSNWDGEHPELYR